MKTHRSKELYRYIRLLPLKRTPVAKWYLCIRVTVDVSLNSGFTALEKGVGNWYVASVKIPAREYDYQPTGETDDEGYDILEEVALDVNMRDVTLCLWGIPDMTQAQKESEVK